MNTSFLGIGATAGLNSELIEKLKTSETKSLTSNIDRQLENNETELGKIKGLEEKFNALSELLSSFEDNDVINTAKQASAQDGDSIVFNSSNTKDLQIESYTVKVSQLAQRDVFQSEKITDPDTLLADGGEININGEAISTTGKSLNDIATAINQLETANASVEQVSDTEYRLVVKGQNEGLDNALTITQTGIDLGLEDPLNKMQSATNAKIEVNGIDYEKSSNKIILGDGLEITAMSLGDTSFRIEEDNDLVSEFMQEIATQYNAIVDYVKTEIDDYDGTMSQKTDVRSIMASIKGEFFNKGTDIFSMGFEFDRYGKLSVNSETLKESMKNDKENFYNVFVGDNKDGVISNINNILEDSLENVLTALDKSQTRLNADRATQITKLDSKYESMALQFASYNTIISGFESSFAGLKQFIDFESSGN